MKTKARLFSKATGIRKQETQIETKAEKTMSSDICAQTQYVTIIVDRYYEI